MFDGNLYYKNGVYRTPTMMDLFSINHFKIKEENLLNFQIKKAPKKCLKLFAEREGFEPPEV